MLDPTTTAVLIGGLTPVAALGVGVLAGSAVKVINKRKSLAGERRQNRKQLARTETELNAWTDKFTAGKLELSKIVTSGNELDAVAALQTQIDLLDYFHDPVEGCESTSYSSRYNSEAIEGMHLTHIYVRAQYGKNDGLSFQRADTRRKYGNSSSIPVDLEIYLDQLKKLKKNLSSEFVSDPKLLQKGKVFAREHAAHLLINYRESVESVRTEDDDFLRKAIARQEALSRTVINLTATLNDVISWEVRASYPTSKALEEAKQLAEAIDVPEEATVAEEESPKKVSLVDTPDWIEGYLTSNEKELIEVYKTALSTLSEEQTAIGENLLGKLSAAVNLSVKAEKFSPAGRAHAMSLAEQNRSLVIAELSTLVEPALLAEEADAIYALRLDNKYLLARQEEAMEGIRNV